jgi:cysteinyl-tRNA synthetase
MSTKYLGERFDIHGGGMDLQFPHHECEIAQSVVCNHVEPARYWIHNNMITINGRKMGKSYNNVIKLSELFTGTHPALEQAYHPMVIRFFILQTHYRSTLDFSNDALKAAERGLKRLWEAYENLNKLSEGVLREASDPELEARTKKLIAEFEEFINDDFNTAKVLANMFEIVPIINGIKDSHIPADALSVETLQLLKTKMKLFVEDIFGLKNIQEQTDGKIDGILHLLMDIRKEARRRKDFVTSDKIRNQLAELGVQLKDEKDGSMSYTFAFA